MIQIKLIPSLGQLVRLTKYLGISQLAYYQLNHQIRCIFKIRCELTILYTFSRVLIKADKH